MAVQLEGLLLWSLGIVWLKISLRTSTISIKILKLPGLFDFFNDHFVWMPWVHHFKEQFWLHIWGTFWSIRSIDTILIPPLPWGCHMFHLEFYTGCPSWCNPKGDLCLQLELDLQHWSLNYLKIGLMWFSHQAQVKLCFWSFLWNRRLTLPFSCLLVRGQLHIPLCSEAANFACWNA